MDLLSTSSLFSEFLAQRRYLRNVTPSTIEWYDTAFKALQRTHGAEPPLTRPAFHAFVVDLRQRGVKPISCNTYIKALNAFCKWLHDEGHLPERLELSLLKLEKRILQTLTDEQMQALLSIKPRSFEHHRLQALIAFLLDTGVRIDEALTLRIADLDFENLLVTVFGKGRKERRIPFSFELRKVLFRWQQMRQRTLPRSVLVFPSRQGTARDQRNSLRGLHLLQARLGLPSFGWHRLRHTFATNWLREGGDIARLSLVLGHTQITTTQRYLHLLTSDLVETQQRTSVLNRLRHWAQRWEPSKCGSGAGRADTCDRRSSMDFLPNLGLLFVSVVAGSIGGLLGAAPTILARWSQGKPLFKPEKPMKLDSPRILYVGLALFAGMAVLSASEGMLGFATAFAAGSGVCGVGLLAFRRGWRG